MQPTPDAKTYIVARSFHLGEAKLNLTAGDRIQFNGRQVTYRDQSYDAPTVASAIKAKLLVEDDGNTEVKKRTEVVRQKPKLVVEDHNDQVVAMVKKPETPVQAEKRTTEQTAKIRGETAPKQTIIQDQAVVATVKVEKKVAKEAPKVIKVDDAAAAFADQQDATVIKTNTSIKVDRYLRQEGVVVGEQDSTPIGTEADGVVVSKVKSLEERKADLKKPERNLISPDDLKMSLEEEARLKAAIEVAKQKRANKGAVKAQAKPVPKAATAEDVTAPKVVKAAKKILVDGAGGFPEGYRPMDPFANRVAWCKAAIERGEHDLVATVYHLSNEKFQAALKQEIPDLMV